MMIEMFKQQALFYAGLIELLKSRDLIGRGDLQAWDALVSVSSRETVERNIEESYRSTGKILGVNGLPPD
ncbi:MAG: hypothetical protein WA826_13740 [Silvibacterium sp.]